MEIGALPGRWRRSSFCEGGQCVEVASAGVGDSHRVEVRDSKDPDGPRLVFTDAEWAAFLAGAKAGEFDPLG